MWLAALCGDDVERCDAECVRESDLLVAIVDVAVLLALAAGTPRRLSLLEEEVDPLALDPAKPRAALVRPSMVEREGVSEEVVSA
jgi:hypothetical protein